MPYSRATYPTYNPLCISVHKPVKRKNDVGKAKYHLVTTPLELQ